MNRRAASAALIAVGAPLLLLDNASANNAPPQPAKSSAPPQSVGHQTKPGPVGYQLVTSNATATSEAASGGVSPNAAINGSGPGWAAQAYNALAYSTNRLALSDYQTYMKRTGGSGTYQTDSHTALIKGYYDGQIVFDYTTNACASVSQKNADSVTCRSQDFSTNRGQQWTQTMGGNFNQGADGSTEFSIAGEIDIFWTS
jgi:hypothetical protein